VKFTAVVCLPDSAAFVVMSSSWRLCSAVLLFVLPFFLLPACAAAAGFLDFLLHPCAYNPHAISELNSSLSSVIVGQSSAVQSTLQLLSEHMAPVAAGGTSSKALVLSFHGKTGTGKTLLATSIGRLLFESFPSPSLSAAASSPSPHVHHFHGMRYDDARYVHEYIRELQSSITESLTQCPLSLFIVEEVHFMQPEVLQHLLPLFSYHAMHDSVSLTQAIFIFTSNIGGEAVQKAAFDAERQQVAREDIAYPLLQRAIT
jgi:ATP-dependent Clp protease ATP-binding subunit ClpA